MNYSGKQALVLGLGESGLAMARWLARCGAAVRVADTREAPARLEELLAHVAGAEFISGPFHGALVAGMDIVAVSPGLSPNGELLEIEAAARAAGLALWGEIELFAQALAALRVPADAAEAETEAIFTAIDAASESAVAGAAGQDATSAVTQAGNAAAVAEDRPAAATVAVAASVAVATPESVDAPTDWPFKVWQGNAPAAVEKSADPAATATVQGSVESMSVKAEAAGEIVESVDAAADNAAITESAEDGEGAAMVVPSPAPAPVDTGYAPKIIAITGTNGKTTVTSLAGLLCQRAGKTVRVAGNISPAALDVLREALDNDDLPEVWVLELSSFQLHTTHSLRADAATVLNLSQDHLDWHGDMASYAADKARIFGADTLRVLNRDDAATMKMAGTRDLTRSFGTDAPTTLNDLGLLSENGMVWLTLATPAEEVEKKRRRRNAPEEAVPVLMTRLMPADALKIRGQHNAANALAALGLCRAIGLPLAPLLHGLRDYQGEPHRVELVSTIADVAYYDDSKGTNVGATVAAVNGLGAELALGAGRLLLIAGGVGKGQDFGPLAAPVARHARCVFLIGRDAPLLRVALQDCGVELIDADSLDAAVEGAAAMASAGDAVLLSPACASFDMFRDYVQRAEKFVEAVREVALSRGEMMA